jgi:CubicO group peptidase (beta-lactamase class C family)
MMTQTTKWQRVAPADAGFDAAALARAIDLAQACEIDAPRDLLAMLPDGSRHPNDRPLGPLKPRGKPSGLVVRDGRIVAEYGDIANPEVTFSATKSYISACAGIAVDRGLIRDVDEPVAASVRDGGFDSPHNRRITWRHLLQQTSEWEGELFGIPDWIDRGRQVGSAASMASRESTIGGSAASSQSIRTLQAPGTFWEYNDVRVNRTALALLRLFGRPLPEVLMETVMRPIGASDSWQWHGYETSWVDVNGRRVQSVSGGAHWGGGLWISTLDHARFGLLFLRKGNWNGQQLLSEDWVRASVTPCAIKPEYGYLWWLNHAGSISEVAGEAAFAARGAGGNIVFVEPAMDVVIVLRWCRDTKAVIDSILETVR